MTPGFAKTRAELPWLPYGECSRVIINAHNFPSSAWTPAVNGKNPVAAWVPSRDTAGNGTTTLTDFIGSRNGTLTNMDAATDWVADTGSGGVRAIDFDGVNDFVTASPVWSPPASASWSFWLKMTETPANFKIVLWGSTRPGDAWNFGWGFYWTSSTALKFFRGSYVTAGVSATIATPSNWNHVVITSSNTVLTSYLNGSQVSTGTVGAINSSPSLIFGEGNSATYNSAVRLDDIRFFESELNSSDVSDLYGSGSGRGVQA